MRAVPLQARRVKKGRRKGLVVRFTMAETVMARFHVLGALGRGDEDKEVDQRWRVGVDEGVVDG